MCPGCLATYAKVLSALGIGLELSETHHLWLLLGCITLSLGFGAREVRATGRAGPMVVTSAGCAVLLAVHVIGENVGMARLSWLGVALLLGGAIWGHRAASARRRGRDALPAARSGELREAPAGPGVLAGVRPPAHAFDAGRRP